MALTKTTLSVAIDAQQNVISLASISSLVAGMVISVNNELMEVRTTPAIASSVQVQRGASGTRANKHPNGAVAAYGTAAEQSFKGAFGNDHTWTQYANGGFLPMIDPQTVAVATAVTLTAGQVLAGMILQDPSGGGVTTTLPTAELLLDAVPNAQIGTTLSLLIRNDADAGETITVAAGTGGTVTGGGTMTIAQSYMKMFWIRFTGVTPGSAAYIVYSLGPTLF